MKRQARLGKNIYKSVSDKGPVSRMYKVLLTLKSKKTA